MGVKPVSTRARFCDLNVWISELVSSHNLIGMSICELKLASL